MPNIKQKKRPQFLPFFKSTNYIYLKYSNWRSQFSFEAITSLTQFWKSQFFLQNVVVTNRLGTQKD